MMSDAYTYIEQCARVVLYWGGTLPHERPIVQAVGINHHHNLRHRIRLQKSFGVRGIVSLLILVIVGINWASIN